MQNQPVLMQIEDYIKAGKIAGEVRENVRKKDWKKSRPRSVITIEVGIRTANLNDATIIDLFYKNV